MQAAVEFQNKHPNETLILVTADHETGGMAIGYKTTNYDTFLTKLAHQKMSYAKFDSTYVQNYIANKTPFEAAMQDVKANFGLTLPTDPDAANAGKLLLTDYEVQNLRTAYERTLKVGSASQKEMSQQEMCIRDRHQGSHLCFRRPGASRQVLHGIRSRTLLLRDPPDQDG